MTPQQAVGLACRLFAVWLALASAQAWMIARAVQTQGLHDAAWLQYAVPGLYWIAAVGLWFFPMSIAHRLVPRARPEDRIALPARQVVLAACVVLGLCVVLLRATPVLSAYAATAVVWIADGQPLSGLGAERHAELLEGLVQLLVGAGFVLKAAPIAAHVVPRPAVREHVSPSLLADSALPDSAL